MRKRINTISGLMILSIVCAVYYLISTKQLLSSSISQRQTTANELTNAAYIWQRAWNEDLIESIRLHADTFGIFMPLGAEVQSLGEEISIQSIPMDLDVFTESERPVCFTLRAHELPGINTEVGRVRIAEKLSSFFNEWSMACTEHKIKPVSMQLDYDCRTEDLAHYTALLTLLEKANPDIELSITTLPTWLQSENFAALVDRLDFFVLQVHSFAPIVDKGKHPVLCDTEKVEAWARKAAAIGVPFYIAWPTYGYRLHFAPDGKLIALQSEGKEEVYAGGTDKIVYADPESIAQAVVFLRNAGLTNYIGNVWFRLPVKGDELNWSWDTLQAVMRGESPKGEITAALRNPNPGLYEVWIKNTENYQGSEDVSVSLNWPKGTKVYYDTFAGFKISTDTVTGMGVLSGGVPATNSEKLVAWVRVSGGEKEAGFNIGEVERMK